MSTDVLTTAIQMAEGQGASDVHLESTGNIYYRVNGELEVFDSPLDESAVKKILMDTWPGSVEALEATGAIDRSATLGGIRVRANISKTITGLSCVMRLIPDEAPTPAQMMMPKQVVDLMDHPNGLILFTGEFGSGKTTGLASLIGHWNGLRRGHILCLEQPTEYIHRPKLSRVSQREIPTHSITWAEGIKDARRSDPDIIMVGELREPEAVEAALAAAASGILVLATMHAGSTVQALTALLAMMDDNRRNLAQIQLSQSLRGIVTQQLLPRICEHCRGERGLTEGAACGNCGGSGTHGRVAAREVLLGTETVRSQVGSGNFAQIPGTIESGRAEGMFYMRHDLTTLVLDGMVTQQTALAATSEPTKLLEDLTRARARTPSKV